MDSNGDFGKPKQYIAFCKNATLLFVGFWLFKDHAQPTFVDCITYPLTVIFFEELFDVFVKVGIGPMPVFTEKHIAGFMDGNHDQKLRPFFLTWVVQEAWHRLSQTGFADVYSLFHSGFLLG